METKSIEKFSQLPVQQSLLKKAESLAARSLSGDPDQRRKIAQEFTSFLYLEMLKAMRAATAQDQAGEGESLSRDLYTSMMDAEVGRLAAKRDSTGFAKAVERALDRAPATVPPRAEATELIRPSAEISADPMAPMTPVAGVISSAFGMRADPLNSHNKFHHGVDIAAPSGAPVKAAAAGKVVFSGQVAGYGNLIEVDHGAGWLTRYGHNSSNLVERGDTVAAGQRIALVGRSGRATGDHVHFEVRRDGKAVDPALFLGNAKKGTRLSAKV